MLIAQYRSDNSYAVSIVSGGLHAAISRQSRSPSGLWVCVVELYAEMDIDGGYIA